MPYTMKADGLTEIAEQLSQMAEKAVPVAAQALYEGAGIMADEVKKGAETIKTAPFQFAREGQRLPSPEEKEIVMAASAGIAKFDKGDDSVDTSVGYRNAGYAELNGKTKPIPVIVNAINSGTSFMNKQPFVRKAAKNGSSKALAAMKASIEKAFEDMTKN